MNSAKAIIVAGALIAAAVMFGLMSRSDARTHDERVYVNAGTIDASWNLWVINPATKQMHVCVLGVAQGEPIKQCLDAGTHP